MLINGKVYWAKIVGKPFPNQFKPGVDQWSFDLSLSDAEAKKLLDKGMRKSFLKNKEDERGNFISFNREATRTDGTEGKPYTIVDAANHPWPVGKLIGNGSEVNVAVILSERTYKGEKHLRPSAVAVQVWDHKEYERKNDFPVNPDFAVKEEGPVKDSSPSAIEDKQW